jgi:hypothetical protein
LDKILTGGSVRVTVEFKEMTLQNFARAYPHAVLTSDSGRVDFTNRVGLSLRSLAKKLTLKKIVGGVESALVKDHLIVPEASPVEGELSVVHPDRSAPPGGHLRGLAGRPVDRHAAPKHLRWRS